MAQEQDNDAVRMAGDPTKISAFDLIERNIMRDVEAGRKTAFQALESSGNQNTFGGLVGRIGLETFDKYGNTPNRVASYVNQAHQMAIDHHNFLVRREELNETGAQEITFIARDIDDTTASANEGLNIYATFSIASPCLVTLSQELNEGSPIRFRTTSGGNLPSPITANTTYYLRTVNAADKTYNLATSTTLTATLVSTAGATQSGTHSVSGATDKDISFDPRIPVEVIRILTISLMMMDAGVPSTETSFMKQQAIALIERNVTTAVEKARRSVFQTLASGSDQNTFGGLAGRIGLETVARYRLSEARIKSYINQAYQAAIDHHNFVARRETYDKATLTFSSLTDNAAIFNNVIPAEVVRLIVLSYIQNDQAAAATAGPLTALAENQR
jgi:hypothetical protein